MFLRAREERAEPGALSLCGEASSLSTAADECLYLQPSPPRYGTAMDRGYHEMSHTTQVSFQQQQGQVPAQEGTSWETLG